MNGKIVYRRETQVYLLDGQEVSKAEFDKAFPPQEGIPMTAAPSCWPKKSSAGWVHPVDREKATKEAARLGVPTEYAESGDPVLRDRRHRKDFYEKVKGFWDDDGGDGDPGVKSGK